jgi:NAD(P)-dependent dehydrogenase (short-subunit alcohol dehydrogenase family)
VETWVPRTRIMGLAVTHRVTVSVCRANLCRHGGPDQRLRHHQSRHPPLRRAEQPAEVAPTYVFFAAQESSYVIAEMLAVTGGLPVT